MKLLYLTTIISIVVTTVIPSYANYSGNYQVDAKLIKAVSVSEERKLSFGKFRVGASKQKLENLMKLNPYTEKYEKASVYVEEGSYSTALIKITGEENAVMYVSVTGDNLESDGNNVLKTKFLLNNNGKILLDSTGNQTIKVGGILKINGNQEAGQYKGYYTIKLMY